MFFTGLAQFLLNEEKNRGITANIFSFGRKVVRTRMKTCFLSGVFIKLRRNFTNLRRNFTNLRRNFINLRRKFKNSSEVKEELVRIRECFQSEENMFIAQKPFME